MRGGCSPGATRVSPSLCSFLCVGSKRERTWGPSTRHDVVNKSDPSPSRLRDRKKAFTTPLPPTNKRLGRTSSRLHTNRSCYYRTSTWYLFFFINSNRTTRTRWRPRCRVDFSPRRSNPLGTDTRRSRRRVLVPLGFPTPTSAQ